LAKTEYCSSNWGLGEKLLEKLVAMQLVKKFPASWNPKIHTNLHRNLRLHPILSLFS
jgi:hypothetical protein